MRGRRCSKLLSTMFVVSVFALGMMCGFYYEAAVSSNGFGDIAARGAPRNVIEDGRGHLREPLNLKQQGKAAVDKASINSDTNSKKLSETRESVKPDRVDKVHENGGAGHHHSSDSIKHQDPPVPDLKGDMEESMEPSDDHHVPIDRKGFGAPIRLQPVVNLHAPASQEIKNQNQNQQPNNNQQPPVPVLNSVKLPVATAKQQPANNVVHPPAVNVPKQQQQIAKSNQQQQPKKPGNINNVHFVQDGKQPQKLVVPADIPSFSFQKKLEEQQQQQANLKQHQQPPVHDVQPQKTPLAVPQDASKNTADKQGDDSIPRVEGKMVMSVVVCGDRTDEALVMLKSAAIMTPWPLHFHIFAEDILQSGIENRLQNWPAPYRNRITFDIHNISFPPGENFDEWKKMFKRCATQRLFLPDLLTEEDALLYVDTDILFTKPVQFIWSFFKKFNSTQLAALTPEHEVTNIGWYNRFARHPYHGATGLNSGVMLMNLTRMRKFGWSAKILPIYREYKTKITWGDQDLINILFHFHPELVYVYPCEWNIRPDHCMYSLNCQRIVKEGVAIIHGNRGVYHNEKQRPFRIIYEAYRDFQFGADLNSGLIEPLRQRFKQQDVASMYCTKALQHPLIMTLQQHSHHGP